MKKRIKEKPFLAELEKIPNISVACEKVGLSRNTVYRWCKEDPTFKEAMDAAISTGIDSINDLAESKLISIINGGDLKAIRYWLDNNKPSYFRPRPKDFWTQKEFVPVTEIVIEPAEKYFAEMRKKKDPNIQGLQGSDLPDMPEKPLEGS